MRRLVLNFTDYKCLALCCHWALLTYTMERPFTEICLNFSQYLQTSWKKKTRSIHMNFDRLHAFSLIENTNICFEFRLRGRNLSDTSVSFLSVMTFLYLLFLTFNFQLFLKAVFSGDCSQSVNKIFLQFGIWPSILPNMAHIRNRHRYHQDKHSDQDNYSDKTSTCSR